MTPVGSRSAIIPSALRPGGTLIGYARVSTEEQQTDPQLDALRAAGCQAIFEERASGGSRSRVELARCLERIGPGDTLVVVRIDRLARSLVPSARGDRAPARPGGAFPEPRRSDRYRQPAGHLHPAGAGRRRGAGASADPRAHQGRA